MCTYVYACIYVCMCVYIYIYTYNALNGSCLVDALGVLVPLRRQGVRVREALMRGCCQHKYKHHTNMILT